MKEGRIKREGRRGRERGMGEKKEREKQRESQTQGCGERQAEPRTREKHGELEARSPEGRGEAEGLPLLVEGP